MTGFGRTGTLFAYQQLAPSVRPDIVCLSKGITGGFLPLSVTITQQEMFDAFFGAKFSRSVTPRPFVHGQSDCLCRRPGQSTTICRRTNLVDDRKAKPGPSPATASPPADTTAPILRRYVRLPTGVSDRRIRQPGFDSVAAAVYRIRSLGPPARKHGLLDATCLPRTRRTTQAYSQISTILGNFCTK